MRMTHSRVDPRADVERATIQELTAWRTQAMPDRTAPLGTDDLVFLFRDLMTALGLAPTIAAEFSVNTVHYYRRKEIIDPPVGRTTSARYSERHVWQIAGARLAGHLGLVTLAEARRAMRGAADHDLIAFVAARVVDARAQTMMRTPVPVGVATPVTVERARPLPGRAAHGTAPAPLRTYTIALPGGAFCVLPHGHAAFTSRQAADALALALQRALGRAAAPSTTD